MFGTRFLQNFQNSLNSDDNGLTRRCSQRWPFRCRALLYENIFIAKHARPRWRQLTLFVRPMKLTLALTLLLLCASVSAKELDRKARLAVERAARRISGSEALFCVMPKRIDASKAVRQLADGIGYAKTKKQPLVIYCPNPDLGKRIVTLVFTAIRPDALRGMTIVCVIGKENESSIRAVVEATGAKLFIEPLP